MATAHAFGRPAFAFNSRLYDLCRELGLSSYPISAVRLVVDDWKAHDGEQWDRLCAAKRRHRPR